MLVLVFALMFFLTLNAMSFVSTEKKLCFLKVLCTHTHTHIYIYIHTHLYTHTYTHTHTRVCVCVCVCVCFAGWRSSAVLETWASTSAKKVVSRMWWFARKLCFHLFCHILHFLYLDTSFVPPLLSLAVQIPLRINGFRDFFAPVLFVQTFLPRRKLKNLRRIVKIYKSPPSRKCVNSYTFRKEVPALCIINFLPLIKCITFIQFLHQEVKKYRALLCWIECWQRLFGALEVTRISKVKTTHEAEVRIDPNKPW